jgi:predicted porin
MKKHLIAAGLVAAFAAPAMAQNVSVYGVIDQAVVNTDKDGAASTTGLSGGTLNSERLGFKGSEDLGGGLKAFFRLEQSIDVGTGTQNAGFNRGAEVGVSGSFGSVKVGKFDLSEAEGIDSSVSQMGNVGLDSGIAMTSDKDDSIQYELPSMGGFKVQIGHSFGDGNGTGYDMNSASVSGKVGPANVYVGYQAVDVAGGENTAMSYGVKLPVGPATVGVYYGDADNHSAADKTNTIVSASMPIGNGLTAHALIGTYTETGANDADKWALGVTKALSKRSTVYAAYASSTDKADVETKQLIVGVTHKF